ncbi:hypothetical protein [Legionella sp. km772]|uniref:hypothetical protein n=1 Tax=Legionella sp. km772 TaxID=2498111 RepID=UPI000F8D1E26|nr:hypothetical protein [Legionella sp. km772]RUR08081.1 hypothetical protein ELY15_11555 [Legionella sp. km772]
METKRTIQQTFFAIGLYALLSWPLFEDGNKKQQFNGQYIKLMLQNYCEFIMREKFGDHQLAPFEIRENKSPAKTQEAYLRSISVLYVIKSKDSAPTSTSCTASVFLNDNLDQIPANTKITIKMTGFNQQDSTQTYTTIKELSFKELNIKYPTAIGATVVLYNKRLSMMDIFSLWLEQYGWKSKHPLPQ